MNRGQAVARMRLYLREPTPANWKDSQLHDLLDEAHAEIHYALLGTGAPFFIHRARFTVPADTREMSMSAAIGSHVARLHLLSRLSEDAEPSRTNIPIVMPPAFEAKSQAVEARALNYPNGLGSDYTTAAVPQIGYWFTGDRLMFIPPPAVDTFIYVEYIKDSEPLTADDQVLLDDAIRPFHFLVPLKASLAALNQIGDVSQFQVASQRFIAAWTILIDALRRQRQVQDPYVIPWIMRDV